MVRGWWSPLLFMPVSMPPNLRIAMNPPQPFRISDAFLSSLDMRLPRGRRAHHQAARNPPVSRSPQDAENPLYGAGRRLVPAEGEGFEPSRRLHA